MVTCDCEDPNSLIIALGTSVTLLVGIANSTMLQKSAQNEFIRRLWMTDFNKCFSTWGENFATKDEYAPTANQMAHHKILEQNCGLVKTLKIET